MQLVRVARLIVFVFPPLSSRCSPIVDVIALIVLNVSQHERLFFQCIGSVNVSIGAKALGQNLFTAQRSSNKCKKYLPKNYS